jgi:hypothetical protein
MRAAALILAATASLAVAQPAEPGHGGKAVLFLAQADGAGVAPEPVKTGGSATGAFIVDRGDHGLSFDLTYHGLETGSPSRIALYNSGSGRNGPMVAPICGSGFSPCPERPAARISGTLGDKVFPPRLLSEFASGRIYLQIDGPQGRAELRGQLEPNGAMVPNRNFIAPLLPRPGSGGTGEGTAVLSETYLPGGRIEVEFSVTVAGTTGEPEAVSLGSAPQASLFRTTRFVAARRLPVEDKGPGTRRRGGGTIAGRYVARTATEKAQLTVGNLMSAANSPTIAVRTSRIPEGELIGVFRPVE